jgi:hypothetical protein
MANFLGYPGYNPFKDRPGPNLQVSAAELCGFEPMNGFSLVRDNLGLPNKPDGHDAHRDDASSNNESLLCF